MIVVRVGKLELRIPDSAELPKLEEVLAPLGVTPERVKKTLRTAMSQILPEQVMFRLPEPPSLGLLRRLMSRELRRERSPIDFIGLLYFGDEWVALPGAVREYADTTPVGPAVIQRCAEENSIVSFSVWVYLHAAANRLLLPVAPMGCVLDVWEELGEGRTMPSLDPWVGWREYTFPPKFRERVISFEGIRRKFTMDDRCHWIADPPFDVVPPQFQSTYETWNNGTWPWRNDPDMRIRVEKTVEKHRNAHGYPPKVSITKISKTIKLEFESC